MAFTPTRISELTLISPQLTDQLPIARGSGSGGRTYRIFVRDLVGGVFVAKDSPTIDLSFDSATLELSADVIDNSITDLKLRDSTKLSVIGRAGNSTGDPADIAAAENGQVLRVNDAGNALGFGPVNLANPNSVTNVLPISAGGSGSNDPRNLVPVGAIMPMAKSVAPVGWLHCNGQTIPTVGTFQGRPAADLQTLRTYLGTTYGPSTGTLPDLRGMFVRGWDDGRGKDPGRAFASDQLDAFQGHKHSLYDPGHMHTITDPGHIHGITQTPHSHTVTDGEHDHGFLGGSVTQNDGGNSSEGPEGLNDADNYGRTAKASSNITIGGGNANITIGSEETGIKKTGNNPVSGSKEPTTILVENPTIDTADAGGPAGPSSVEAPRTADETRPENVALYYCIKY
jgi:microcystin-dependent protein